MKQKKLTKKPSLLSVLAQKKTQICSFTAQNRESKAIFEGFLLVILFTLLTLVAKKAEIPLTALLNKWQQKETQFKRKTFSTWDVQAETSIGELKLSFDRRGDQLIVQVDKNKGQLKFKNNLKNAKFESSEKETKFFSEEQNLEISYEALDNGVKEKIVLYQLPENNLFYSQLEIDNLHVYQEGKYLVFENERGEYQFHLDAPYAYDDAGSITYDVHYQIVEVDAGQILDEALHEFSVLELPHDQNQVELINLPEKNIETEAGKLYQLVTVVDEDWLYSPDRQAPITIDPTIIYDTSTEFAGGELNRLLDEGSGSDPEITTSFQELSADIHTRGLWHMNETTTNTCSGGTNDVCDSSGNSLDGAFNGNTTFTTDAVIGASATTFDGSSGYVYIADNSALSFPDNKMTMEFWVRRNGNPSSNEYVVMKGNSPWEYASYILTDGTIRGGLWTSAGSTVASVTSSSTITDNEWHHVAITSNGEIFAVYIDGELDNTSNSFSGNMSDTAANFFIGDRPATADSELDGEVDEVRISDYARSAEEVRLSASYRPYSVYTSDVIDLTNVTSWNSLSWNGDGFPTGDGETATASAQSSLIAQWNFNETSGTTADNAEGTAALDGTLTNFASTGSQDAAAGTGWTADNRRWGAGAITFDGINDYVVIGSESTFDFERTDEFSLEAWIKTDSDSTQAIISKMDDVSPWSGYELRMMSTGLVNFTFNNTGITNSINVTTSSKTVNDSEWHHVLITYDGSSKASGVKIYVDGISETFDTTYDNLSSSTLNNVSLSIGSRENETVPFKGNIDAVKVYDRALTPFEVLSNYNGTQIEFETRVGATSDPNDGSWEEWKPTSSETQLFSFDDTHLYNTSDSGLVAYWAMDDSSGTTVTDHKNSLNGTATGTSINEGVFNNARGFDGSTSDYITVSDNDSLDLTSEVSIELWAKFENVTDQYQELINKRADSPTVAANYALRTGSTGNTDELDFYFYAPSTYHVYRTTNANLEAGKWYHLVATYDGTTTKIYKNGKLLSGSCAWGTCNVSMVADDNDILIGKQASSGYEFNGMLDEIRLYSSVISASTVLDHYLAGSSNPNYFFPQSDETIKMEGTASAQIKLGGARLDEHTIGLWHLDETGGTSAYFKDSSVNGNNGTPSGTPDLVDGIFNKARYMTESEGIVVSHDSSLTPSSGKITIEAWFKTSQSTSAAYESSIIDRVYNGGSYPGYRLSTGGNTLNCWVGGGAYVSTTETVNDGQWHHGACTYDGTSTRIYLDGDRTTTTAQTANLSATQDLYLGWDYNGVVTGFDGSIDEIRISDYARSADEINETYRNGLGHHINYEISSSDLSNSDKLPFYFAADRLGSFSQINIAESVANNYDADNNSVGIWHLDEFEGGGAWLEDTSGNGNNATPTGTELSVGKISQGRYFDGTNDYLTVANSSSLQLTGDASWEGWVKADLPLAQRGSIFFKHYNNEFEIILATDGLVQVYHGNGSWEYMTPPTNAKVKDNVWTHVAVTRDSSSKTYSWYIDGQYMGSHTYTATPSSSTNALYIGQRSDGSLRFLGDLDELRISNTVRTAAEIRQAYEIGKRSHTITVDFKAELDSGNLITGSGDTSFTIDETAYGSELAANHVFTGDKIIVKENYDGTEYVAQGTVASVNSSTGAITVTAWDTGSTFPTSGYTVGATVFKWQREYFDISDILSDQRDAVTNISFQAIDGFSGANIWLDDFNAGSYLSTPTGSTIASSLGNRYFQFRAIFTNTDDLVSSVLKSVTLDYTSNETPSIPTFITASPRISIGDDIKLSDQTPVVYFSSTDNESEDIVYEIEWDDDGAFGSSTSQDSATHSGFNNEENTDTSPFNSGDEISYTWQSNLTNGTTYYYRIRAKDPSGSNTWSSWSETRAFTIDTSLPSSTANIWFQTETEQFNSDLSLNVDIDTASDQATIDSGASTATLYGSLITANTINSTADYWQTFSTSHTLNNAVIKYQFNTLVGGVPTPISDTILPGNWEGFTDSSIDLSALDTTSYPSIIVEALMEETSADPVISDWQVSLNALPATPTITTASFAYPNLSFEVSSTDSDADYLQYKIEICDDSGMTTNCETADQTSSQTGWSGQDAQSSTAYASGTTATYTATNDYAYGSTHYYRVSVTDPAGTGYWVSTSVGSATTNTPPTATALTVNGSTNPTGVTDLTPTFSATFNDTDGGASASKYQIEVADNQQFTSLVWDPGEVSISGSLTNGNTLASISEDPDYAGTALSLNGLTYYWRIRFWDDKNDASAWSNTAYFTMYHLGKPQTCLINRDPSTNNLLVKWADSNSNRTSITLERSVNHGSFSTIEATLAPTTVEYLDTTTTSNNKYQYRLAVNYDGKTSDWCYTPILDLSTGFFNFDGINLEGVNLF